MKKVISSLVKYRRTILVTLAFFVAFGFSILSSYIVQNLGCGSLGNFIDCGFYAGFPVPYARHILTRQDYLKNKLFLNPTFYYKYKYSPLEVNRRIANQLIKDGRIFPFFLQEIDRYDLDMGMFLLNSILWLAPAGFLILVFF